MGGCDAGRETGRGFGESVQLEASVSGQGRAYQAAGDLTVNEVTFNLPQPPPPVGQVVEGDVPRQPHAFQERDDLLTRVRERIVGRGPAVGDAITGTPGVGKSMLAASYAWACQREGWPVIAWINAETEDQIITGLAGLARRLGLFSGEDDARSAAVKARNRLAAADQPTLLVFDNAVQVDHVRPWCPATGSTRILITTRNQAFYALFPAIDVGVFSPDQSVALLHQRTGNTTPGAEQVATELGHLPLALGQAGAYIHRRRLTYPAYLTLLREYPLHRHLPPQPHGEYPHGAAAAILLSIDQVTPHARDLLELLAVLSEAGVPRAILYGTTTPDLAHAETIDRLLADLADTSLISFSEDGTTVLMHRLTSRVLRERAHLTATGAGGADSGESRLVKVLDGAVDLLHCFNDHIPGGAAIWTARTAVEMLVEQTAALYALATASDDLRERLLSLRAWCGSHLRDLADLGRAVPLLEQNLADREQVLGGEHPDTLTSRNDLALAYRVVGDLGRAIPLLEQALVGSERVLGGDHPETLGARNSLASAYREAGDLGRAIPLYVQNVADCARVIGRDHPNALTSRNNLAAAYQEAGDLGRAILLYEQVLADRVRVLGGDHSHTLHSHNNLAGAYHHGGDLGRAILLCEQTLVDCERVLGADHPTTKIMRANALAAREGDVRTPSDPMSA